MVSAISKRVELAKFCSSRDWSKAIRVLDSLLAQSCAIQDLCNRAFCYSQLELHKHVIKDCDKALQLDPMVLQAYILKGRALAALSRNEDAILVWEQGYEHALHRSADLTQLLELEELLKAAKQESAASNNIVTMDRTLVAAPGVRSIVNVKSTEAFRNKNKDDISKLCNESHQLSACNDSDSFEMLNGLKEKASSISSMHPLLSVPHDNVKSSESSINPNELSDKFKLTIGLRGDKTDVTDGLSYEGRGLTFLPTCYQAIEDLTKALEFEPNSADILHERGIVNFKFKDFNAAIEDLSTCLKLDKDNQSAYTYLGLALSSIGEYKRAEEAYLKSIKLDKNFLEGWGHLTQFYQELANYKRALECLQQVLQIDNRYARAYHLRGLLLHGMGEHRYDVCSLLFGYE
ncbi:suppressor of RPS4-RLD 1-like [Carica papaya]|uniref:suppressor of RPS4-RLD 1-like n=1 Tax=Carica papaya TaxID=3649 RepID=UPI000B8C9856|nr:suppressor of RPS4-RLD 1-like [Carica papaya]